MTTSIRFAIIGSGAIAGKHAQAIDAIPDAELVAVWGQVKEQGEVFAKAHGASFVDNLEELATREDIDAVTIATPSGTHAEMALPMLRRGKSVLCEKPLDVTLEKVDSILEVAEANEATLAGVLQLRLGTGAQALKRAIEQGRFGRLVSCSAYLKWWRDQAYYDAVDWRGTWKLDGGGALMNQGIHAVDLLQWLVGMPKEVFAFADCLAHERLEVEDTIALTLKYPNGSMGVIEASTACHPGGAMRIEVSGDQGSAVLEDDTIVRWDFKTSAPEDEAIRNAGSGGIIGGSKDPNSIGFEGHRILIEDLVDSIRSKRPPMISGTEARNAVKLIEAAYASAQAGKPVSLNES